MFDFVFKYFAKPEEKVETEEDRHKLLLRCSGGKWIIEEKYEIDGKPFWSPVFSSEDQETARERLQKERDRVYNIHNGTIEYW